MRKPISVAVSASLLLAGCAGVTPQTGSNQPPGASQEAETTAEGGLIGAAGGAGIGALLGGKNRLRGALIGGLVGGLIGTAAGNYVAKQKTRYASIEQRIDGERALASQAVRTAQAQCDAAQASLAVADGELAELQAARGDRVQAQQKAQALLDKLAAQRATLSANQKTLQTHLDEQQAFIRETETEMGANPDPQKAEQLAQWKAEIPKMQVAVDNMTTQVTAITALETRTQNTSVASS